MIKMKSFPFSAASGLVKRDHDFYIVADDENVLYHLKDSELHQYSLFSGTLPENLKDRKKVKADLESLCIHDNLILGFPSGSTKQRETGVIFNCDNKSVAHFDLSLLYENLREKFTELNIEGATFVRDELWLFQRGNGGSAQNAIITIDRKQFLIELQLGKIKSYIDATKFDLGMIGNVSLGFTDACSAHDHVYFLAVAEDTESTYDDGKFIGSVIGQLSLDKKVLYQKTLSSKYKPEGLWIEGEKIYFVTDADDRNIPSELIQTTL